MDNDKCNEALRACDKPMRWTGDGVGWKDDTVRHVRWMIAEALSWPAERLEKKFRWLGFIQGVLWTEGIVEISVLKRMNMPDRPGASE